MPDYKAMYFKLFNSVTDAIELLQKAQLEAENAFMASENEPTLISLEVHSDKSAEERKPN